MIRAIFDFQEKYKTSRISFGDSFEVPEFEREFDFDPVNVVVRTKESRVTIRENFFTNNLCRCGIGVKW